MNALRLAVLVAGSLLFSACDGVVDLMPLDPTGPPAAAWGEMLAAVNALRAEGRTCGDEYFAPAEPLVWDGRLEAAAQRHTRDMASHDYFDHVGTDGSTVGERASQEGYAWRRVGENIARHQEDVREVVQDWAESPGHCANLMNPAYVEFGAAEMNAYWTQVFGRPR